MPELVIAPGDLTDPRVLRLLEDHLADMHATSPAESVHALDVSGLSDPAVTFWAVSDGEAVLGCVALKQLSPEHGELKSMRADAAARGQGLGRRLLEHVLDEARSRGYARISLETGTEDFFAPARALYEKAGFTVCPPFGSYELDPNSAFYTLELAPGA
ncbi:GNAT family N-acetyltransferase [Agromyces allii]|uniref:GNAT family N-acetyltransferase n=1 Tax=Agromyces allii TaxID=393607 RepID=A0ABP5CJD0_9MICO|nr:GNAT family N-acetyltransferase [Agromyces allii]